MNIDLIERKTVKNLALKNSLKAEINLPSSEYFFSLCPVVRFVLSEKLMKAG